MVAVVTYPPSGITAVDSGWADLWALVDQIHSGVISFCSEWTNLWVLVDNTPVA